MTNPDLVAPPRSELSSLLGPSEPNWAMRARETRLVGLLNLSCLLSRTTYVTDNDLSDNIHFLEGFRRREDASVYARVREFARLGFVRILLRDSLYGPNFHMPVDSFEDVYRSWLARDSRDAWIIKDFSQHRVDFFRDLDSWALDHSVRYPYRAVKESFMADLRNVLNGDGHHPLARAVSDLPEPVQADYRQLVDGEWFSLTNINATFQRHGITIDDPAMHYHGMLNQQTFSDYSHSSLLGADAEETAASAKKKAPRPSRQLQTVELEEILERAETILDGPSLAVLGRLRPQEIAELRELGGDYFTLLELAKHPEGADYGVRLVRAAINYWAQICDFIRTRHGYLSERPTRLALFVGYDPALPQAAAHVFSLAIDAGLDLISSSTPLAKPAATVAKALKGQLRFLFLTPTEEYEKISLVLPRSFWFRHSRPGVPRPEGT